MKRYFNTKENALRHLEYRKECAYKRIEENKDNILGDASFMYQDHRKKWIVFMLIITERMMRDIENINIISHVTTPLIPFSLEEEFKRKTEDIQTISEKYKTLDIVEYTNIKP